MEKAKEGKSKVLLFRLAKERASKKAAMLALQVTHTIKKESKAESTATKDGNVTSSGRPEVSIEFEALLSDTEIVDMLEYAVDNAEQVEVWEVDIEKPIEGKTNKYEAKYGTGVLEGWETPAEVGTNSSVKTTMKLNGNFEAMKNGATMDELQAETAKAFVYDTIANATKEEAGSIYTPDVTPAG